MATRKTPGTSTPRATTRRPAAKRTTAAKAETKPGEEAKPAAKPSAAKAAAKPAAAKAPRKPAASKTAVSKPAPAKPAAPKAPAKPRAPAKPKSAAAKSAAAAPAAPAPSIAQRIEAAPTAVKAAGIAGLVAAIGGAVLGAFRIFRRAPAEGTVPTDLMGDTHPDGSKRAIDDFRPDPTAPVPESEREALRPPIAKPTLVAGQAEDLPGSRP